MQDEPYLHKIFHLYGSYMTQLSIDRETAPAKETTKIVHLSDCAKYRKCAIKKLSLFAQYLFFSKTRIVQIKSLQTVVPQGVAGIWLILPLATTQSFWYAHRTRKEVNIMPRQRTPWETHAQKISVSFTPEDYQKCIEYCEKHERTLSWVVRKALQEWLEKHKDDPVV